MESHENLKRYLKQAINQASIRLEISSNWSLEHDKRSVKLYQLYSLLRRLKQLVEFVPISHFFILEAVLCLLPHFLFQLRLIEFDSCSQLALKAILVRLKCAELLHEALIRLRLLSMRVAEVKGGGYIEAKAPHDVHYKRGGAARLTHGAVDQDTHWRFPGLQRVDFLEVALDATVLYLFICHLYLKWVRLTIDFDDSCGVRIGHLTQIDPRDFFI